MELTWAISTAIALVVLLGGIITRDRQIIAMITASHEATLKAAAIAASDTNTRLDRVKDEYVRRVDLDNHLSRLDTSIREITSEMRSNQRATTDRLDTLLDHFGKNRNA